MLPNCYPAPVSTTIAGQNVMKKKKKNAYQNRTAPKVMELRGKGITKTETES